MCKTEARYQVREGFVHRQVADADVLIPIGNNVANFNGYIMLNPTASFLWDALTQAKSAGELINLLLEEFDVTPEVAQKDVSLFLEMLRNNDMVTVYEEA